jgi:tetratricopeptide (TPR) repeat protein
MRALKVTKDEEHVRCLLGIADTCRMTGDFTRALDYYSRAIGQCNKNSDLLTDATVGLGLSKRALGDWKDSISLFGKAEKTYRRLDDKEGVAFCLWAMAGALRIRGDIPEAVRTFKKAHGAYLKLNDAHGAGYCLCGLGGTTRVRGQFTRSLDYYTEANDIFSILSDSFGTAYSHCGMGNALRMQGDYDGARDHFRRAIRIYKRIGDIVSYSYTLWSMGKTYMMTGKNALAERYFNNSLRLFRKTKDPRGILYCRMGLAELKAIRGGKGNAARMLESVKAEAKDRGFLVELCHAGALLSCIRGKTDNACYRKLGLETRYESIPFNIP